MEAGYFEATTYVMKAGYFY